MLKRLYYWIAAFAILFFTAPSSALAQQVALKTNLLYDATATPNIGMEIGVGKKHSLQAFYGLNPWKFGHASIGLSIPSGAIGSAIVSTAPSLASMPSEASITQPM